MKHHTAAHRKEIEIVFSGVSAPWGFLGNMAPFPVFYEGLMWRTSEALFQALRFEDEEIRRTIQAQKSPMAAKMKARKFATSMTIAPMGERDIENMKQVLKLKFDTHEAIRNKLLATQCFPIIEDIGARHRERDFFWGMKKKEHSWEGKNTMGKLLMELREAYRTCMEGKEEVMRNL